MYPDIQTEFGLKIEGALELGFKNETNKKK